MSWLGVVPCFLTTRSASALSPACRRRAQLARSCRPPAIRQARPALACDVKPCYCRAELEKRPLNVSITPALEAFVRSQVEGGRYNNAGEVVRAVLRAMEEREQACAAALVRLKALVDAGLASGPAERRRVPGGDARPRGIWRYVPPPTGAPRTGWSARSRGTSRRAPSFRRRFLAIEP